MQILVRGATSQQHEFCLMVGLHGSVSRTAVKHTARKKTVPPSSHATRQNFVHHSRQLFWGLMIIWYFRWSPSSLNKLSATLYHLISVCILRFLFLGPQAAPPLYNKVNTVSTRTLVKAVSIYQSWARAGAHKKSLFRHDNSCSCKITEGWLTRALPLLMMCKATIIRRTSSLCLNQIILCGNFQVHLQSQQCNEMLSHQTSQQTFMLN